MSTKNDYASLKVLEIIPFEPPASGWVKRVKLLRQVIRENGGECQVLDIGPSRKIEGRDCVCVYSAWDYIKKVTAFSKKRYAIHTHINAEYFRGQLLMLAALLIGRVFGCRTVTTFHAGLDQPYLSGWKKYATWPFMSAIFFLSHAVVCNSEEIRKLLSGYVRVDKIHAVQAFSAQYLEFDQVELDKDLRDFIDSHQPILSTYLCFRDGFFVEVLIDAMAEVLSGSSKPGLVIVGTGDDIGDYCDARALEQVRDHIFMTGDLDHNSFMSLLDKSDLCVRTPVTDGVSATVLESLALGTPVLASENGTRPEGVITYEASNAKDMAAKLQSALDNLEERTAALPKINIPDTARDEINLFFPRPG